MSRDLPTGSPIATLRRVSRLTLALSMAFAAGTAGAQPLRHADVPPPQDTPYLAAC